MRIDPSATLGGYLALQVRALLRKLNNRISWDLSTVETTFGVSQRQPQNLVKGLEDSGLAKRGRGARSNIWTTTPFGPVVRRRDRGQADYQGDRGKALADSLERVKRVNRHEHGPV